MINRPSYINKLLSFKDKHLIKILTGVHRCGKSTLFNLYQRELLKSGVTQEQIININFEDPQYRQLLSWETLYDHVNERLLANQKNYIFFDEIQNVKDFQKAADGLFIKENVDLYLTGSNAHLQSGKWATMLSGRFIEIHVLPLSFKEYMSSFDDTTDIALKYQNYVEYSSFPQGLEFKLTNGTLDKNAIRDYLGAIYNTIVLKDVVEGNKIQNIGHLESVISFIASNIGSQTSINNIAKTMTADGRSISTHTVENYIEALCNSYILYKVVRYDIKGKKLLQTLDKYYIIDVGLKYFILGDKNQDNGHILENIVYLELIRRGYKVYIGKAGNKEVDFVVEGINGTEYYQVADSIAQEETLQRELSALETISDHNPKFLLTKDFKNASYNGIKQMNVFEWLLYY
jgi:predicted AAA+ superfamily ATPase